MTNTQSRRLQNLIVAFAVAKANTREAKHVFCHTPQGAAKDEAGRKMHTLQCKEDELFAQVEGFLSALTEGV